MFTIVICPNCGKNTPEGKFCEQCGASVQTTQTFQQPVAQQPVYPQQPAAAKEEKSAGVAAILSFIFTGSGQVYNGDLLRGIGILVGTIIGSFIFLIPGIIVWIYGIYDAYTTAQKMNKGEIPFKPTNAGLVIGFIVVYILIALAMVFFVFLAMLSSSKPYYY